LIESFRYPRRGPGMMWEAAARKIQENGGRIVMDRKFEKLRFDPERQIWGVDTISSGGTCETFEARHVVSSAPILELLAALSPAPLTLLHARALKYRDFITVVLIGRTERTWPDNWIYIHDPRVTVGRVQNFRSWSPEMVPDTTSTCLGLEYFCCEDDDLWSMADNELIALGKQESSAIGLMRGGEVYDACVVRQKKAYPVSGPAFHGNRSFLAELARTAKPVFVSEPLASCKFSAAHRSGKHARHCRAFPARPDNPCRDHLDWFKRHRHYRDFW